MRCTLARETLSADLDGEASKADVLDAVRHVRRCPACRLFRRGIVDLTRVLRAATLIRPSSIEELRR